MESLDDRISRLVDSITTIRTGTIGGYSYYAKVYDAPSKYGIDCGRISKLEIRATLFGDVVYRYDRGVTIDRLSDASFNRIIKHIESTI